MKTKSILNIFLISLGVFCLAVNVEGKKTPGFIKKLNKFLGLTPNSKKVMDILSISVNAANINDNAGSINANAGSINDNAGSINANAGSINDNAVSINDNAGSINDNAGSINANAGNINDNAGSINDNAGTISENTGNIAKNTADIAKYHPPSTKILISTGDPWTAKKTEVIDLEDSKVICEDLEDFPMEIDGAVGAKLASTPIICGGSFNNGSSQASDKCFKYMEGGWQHFATMIERRAYAAGIVYNNALHIFGGNDYDPWHALQSSEIVTEDGSTTLGPQLPAPITYHAIASINSTVSIMIGGWPGIYSDKTWYFNHAIQEFQSGPNLLEVRKHHSSGTVTDQETKEKMTIIAGGDYSTYMDSTEMLFNGEWMTGPALPKALKSSSMVELGDNLYIIGGRSSGGSFGLNKNEIHQLSCFSGNCSWTTLIQQLKVARSYLVAIPVDNTFCP